MLYEGADLAEGLLDRAAHRRVAEAMFERAAAFDQPERAFTRLEVQPEIAEQDRARPVEQPRLRTEDLLDGGHALGRGVGGDPHRRPSGTQANPEPPS